MADQATTADAPMAGTAEGVKSSFALALEHLQEIAARLTQQQKLAAIGAVALAIALIVGAFLWAKEPPYSVLFSNLNDQDGGQIVTLLKQQNVPYKFDESGNAILVPAGQVHDVRLRLASQGLPKGGIVGFEIMENQKLGISQFSEQINYQRGLAGELARSIQTLIAVSQARVHLGIPKQTAFLRDDQKPSASVLLTLKTGMTLDSRQIAGIIHLVASSVPQLKSEDVSVIDQDGNLLSKTALEKQAGLDPTQLRYIKDIETQYLRRIESILEPILGKGNFRAQVSADIDFSQIDQVAEIYKPNPTPETAIRSQQTAETSQTAPQAQGVPGALTNQPPVPATAPITSPAVSATGGAQSGQGGPYSRNATINYEVDKTVRHTRGTPGVVRRLSVALAVNHRPPADGKGKPGTVRPPSEEEMKRITDLVRQATGLSQERGDSISVAAANFVPPQADTGPQTPLWKDPEMIALGKEFGKYLVFLFIAYLVWLKLLKPIADVLATAVKQVAEARKTAQSRREVEEVVLEDGTRPISFEERVQAARDFTHAEPKVVAELVKGWLNAGTGT